MAIGNVKMRVWDVKHGNAIFIRTPNGKHLVYDLGRGDYSENSDDRSPLETLRDHYGIRTIDYLMITHPHKDHIDDILNIDDFTVKSLHRPKHLNRADVMNSVSERDRAKFEKYFALHEGYTTPVGPGASMTSADNNGGVDIEIFSTPTLPKDNLNNHSIISVITYEEVKVIIPGDNEYASLDLLMQRDDFRQAIKNCDILIAPHHGRESAYHNEFVSLANPRLTIISDGSLKDTSANAKYSSKSRGWSVYYNGNEIQRKLLTTNCDGEVYIDFGRNNESRYLQVVIK